VRHWRSMRPPRWRLRAAINGAGATMTAIAVVVFLGSKFLEGAWVVVLVIPMLMLLFWRIEVYYDEVARELRLGQTPPAPHARASIVIVPTTTISVLTELALSAALSLGDRVVAIAVAGDEEEADHLRDTWGRWACNVRSRCCSIPTARSYTRAPLHRIARRPRQRVMVLIPQIIPHKRRHEILHNQRARLLESALKARTQDVVIASLPFHIDD